VAVVWCEHLIGMVDGRVETDSVAPPWRVCAVPQPTHLTLATLPAPPLATP
jgi:hypothetical protein